jgi:hypothetical protein
MQRHRGADVILPRWRAQLGRDTMKNQELFVRKNLVVRAIYDSALLLTSANKLKCDEAGLNGFSSRCGVEKTV